MMILDTSENPSVAEFLDALRLGVVSGNESLILRRNFKGSSSKTPVPVGQVSWFAGQIGTLSDVQVSSGSYHGRSILPNLCSTKCISVEIPLAGRSLARSSRELYLNVCSTLNASSMPLPSAMLISRSAAIVIWLSSEPYNLCQLGEYFLTEKAFIFALREFGPRTMLRAASRFLPLPNARAGQESSPVAVVTSGALKTICRNALTRASRNAPTTLIEAEAVARNVAVIEELGALLCLRSLDVAADTLRHPIWLSAYLGASCIFAESAECSDIFKACAQSLIGEWALIKSRIVPAFGTSYETFMEIGLEFAKAQKVRLHAPMSAEDPVWVESVAKYLNVTVDESNELELAALHPKRSVVDMSRTSARRRKWLGSDDCLSLSSFVNAVAA